MIYKEAVEKIKIYAISNNGLKDPDNITCIKCNAKSLCMKYSSRNDTLKKKYIIKYSCECGYSSKTNTICPLCGSNVKYIGTVKIKRRKNK